MFSFELTGFVAKKSWYEIHAWLTKRTLYWVYHHVSHKYVPIMGNSGTKSSGLILENSSFTFWHVFPTLCEYNIPRQDTITNTNNPERHIFIDELWTLWMKVHGGKKRKRNKNDFGHCQHKIKLSNKPF